MAESGNDDRTRVSSHFLLVPGPWPDGQPVVLALRDASFECSPASGDPIRSGEVRVQWVGADGLAPAFQWGARAPTPVELPAWVADQRGAVVLEVGLRVDEAHAALARIGRALRGAGGLAVRAEASGAACDLESWIRVFEAEDVARTFRLLVAIVGDSDSTFTCGMHLFDLPEAEISGLEATTAIEWVDALCLYQLLEEPTLSSGHTFRPDSEHERRYLERWPDPLHEVEDGRHNPFGVWRILEASRRVVHAREPALMLIQPRLGAPCRRDLRGPAVERGRGRGGRRPEQRGRDGVEGQDPARAEPGLCRPQARPCLGAVADRPAHEPLGVQVSSTQGGRA